MSPRRSVALIVLGVAVLATGCNAPQARRGESPASPDGDRATRRVTGIGGVFFKSDDPARVLEWYRTHLGIASADWGGFAFQWSEKNRPKETGYTVWTPFPDTTHYFSPSAQPYMINFRVADLVSLIAALKEDGVEVIGEINSPQWKVRLDPRPGRQEGRAMGAGRFR